MVRSRTLSSFLLLLPQWSYVAIFTLGKRNQWRDRNLLSTQVNIYKKECRDYHNWMYTWIYMHVRCKVVCRPCSSKEEWGGGGGERGERDPSCCIHSDKRSGWSVCVCVCEHTCMSEQCKVIQIVGPFPVQMCSVSQAKLVVCVCFLLF